MGDPHDPLEDFDAAAARLRAAVADAYAGPGPWPACVCAAIAAGLRFAVEDPAATRLLLVDSRGRGKDAVLLQGLIGVEVGVVVNQPGHLFDCGFHARLERVETLFGDDGPVLLVFTGAQGIALDPAEFDCFLARWRGKSNYDWLELRFGEDALPEARMRRHPEPGTPAACARGVAAPGPGGATTKEDIQCQS